MLRNYLKIALRNIHKHKVYSLINISGLAVGMACSILIFLYVKDELSYDRFHEKSDQIYRIVSKKSNVMPGLVAPILVEESPEIIDAVRIYASRVWGRSGLVSYADKQFYTDHFFLADPSFFRVFSFPLIKGNPETALVDLQSIVLTEEIAAKYFGDEDPIGKVLIYENKYEFKVTGVLKNVPHNSHIKFDFIIPLENYRVFRSSPNGLEEWFNSAFVTYLLFKKNYNPEQLENRLPAIIKRHSGEKLNIEFSLQPITQIHLYSHLKRELETNSDIRYVYIFSVIALLIMLIACINFMNLATARSANRTKEVGMRKVVGAQRLQLIRQFLSESILMSVIAFVFAIGLVILFLPTFNTISGKEITVEWSENLYYIFVLTGVAVVVGAISGSYPAFFLSAFQPAKVLKGVLNVKTKGQSFIKNGFVVIQFAISICMLVGSGIIYNQMEYVRNKNLGFEKEQVVIIPTRRNQEAREKIETIKNEILQNTSVINAGISSQVPGKGLFRRGIKIDGDTEDTWRPIYTLWVDRDFIETYKITLVAGRNFSQKFASDATSSLILNETAARMIGWEKPEDALDMRAKTDGKDGKVIGVVKDFHFMSLQNEIEPIVMHIDPNRYDYLSVRISTENVPGTLSYLKNKWEDILPQRPFEYFFLDTDYDKQYRTEIHFGQIFGYFTSVAIFIACLGLFALASFTAEQRTKEIGIRKVFGASVANIVLLLSTDFTKWVIAANVIAWPIAYFAMDKWLQDFAYRINIDWITFILSAGVALIIALLTVSYQALKAAIANPMDTLRYE